MSRSVPSLLHVMFLSISPMNHCAFFLLDRNLFLIGIANLVFISKTYSLSNINVAAIQYSHVFSLLLDSRFEKFKRQICSFNHPIRTSIPFSNVFIRGGWLLQQEFTLKFIWDWGWHYTCVSVSGVYNISRKWRHMSRWCPKRMCLLLSACWSLCFCQHSWWWGVQEGQQLLTCMSMENLMIKL